MQGHFAWSCSGRRLLFSGIVLHFTKSDHASAFCYVEAYCSRSDHYCFSAAVAGYGAERRAHALPFLTKFVDAIAQRIVEAKNHFNASAELIRSEEIDRRQTG